MRAIRQPGPAPEERLVGVPALALPIAETLKPGRPLVAALHDLVRRKGCDSGVFRLLGGALFPVSFVIPALSPDGSQAAFYSETFTPAAPLTLTGGAVTVGVRDGEPFFHLHGFWTDDAGRPGGGHVLPQAAVIHEAIRVEGHGLLGACFTGRQDDETGFKLFEPVSTMAGVRRPEHRRALALRLRPNQDITLALEAACAERGFAGALLSGGVGSTIGARFIDQPQVDNFATELFVSDGLIDPGGAASALDIALVDLTGALAAGRLVRGDNPILMTLEAALVEDDAPRRPSRA